MQKEFIKSFPVSELIPYENNPRNNDDAVDDVAESMNQCGDLDPIEIDENNVILSGHTRLKAMLQRGQKTADVLRYTGLTEEQKQKYRLLANKTSEKSAWDFEKLEEELKDLDFNGFDFGFDLSTEEEHFDIEEDEIPEEAPTRCKKGDIWQLGDHRLMCGDATNKDDVEKLAGGGSVDIAFTSPPYGVSESAKLRKHYVRGEKQIESFYDDYSDDINEWESLMDKSFKNMASVTAVQFVNVQMLAQNKTKLFNFIHNNVDKLCDIIIWDKQKAPPQMQKNVLNNQFEFIFIFTQNGNSRCVPFANFHGNKNNVLSIPTGNNEYSEIHKAVFPMELPSAIIDIASESKSVIDLFGGIGTTLIVCEHLKKQCFMMELNPKYCDIILQRWENLTGKKAQKIK